MPVQFDEEFANRMQFEALQIGERFDSVALNLINRVFRNELSKESAIYGYIRRLNTMGRCISNVFSTIPVQSTDIIPDTQRVDATISIESFIINCYGALDNIARLWIHEIDLRRDNGDPIPREWIGLRQSNTLIRGSFSEEMQRYLNSKNDWFAYLESAKHALAHNIPLYIPPYTVSEDNHARYVELSNQLYSINGNSPEEDNRLRSELRSITDYAPYIRGSFITENRAIIFHPQMISDYLMVEEIGNKVIQELEIRGFLRPNA